MCWLLGSYIKTQKEHGTPLNDMARVWARSFSVEQVKRFAAAINDPARMALTFAGVASNSNESDALIIRGNTPKGVLWRMEDVEIPNPNHFAEEGATGGGISALSVNVLGNSDFFTGAFSAEYGNATSGVFDLKLRKGNSENRQYAVQVGVMGFDVAAEGPFSKNNKEWKVGKRKTNSFGLNLRSLWAGGNRNTTYEPSTRPNSKLAG